MQKYEKKQIKQIRVGKIYLELRVEELSRKIQNRPNDPQRKMWESNRIYYVQRLATMDDYKEEITTLTIKQ